MRYRIGGWLALLCLFTAQPGRSQRTLTDQINPPFGLYWGETTKEIEKVLARAQARVTDKQTVQGRDSWTVEGLIQPALRRAIMYYGLDHTLVEVELQYERQDWDMVAYEEFLSSARQRLESKYGPPTVLAKDKKPQGDIMQTVVGYQWQQAGSSIQLFFFSAERNNEVYRTVSLHYRAG